MSLRRTLLQLLVTLPVLPGCYFPDDPPGCGADVGNEGATNLTEPEDASLQALIDDCRAVGGFGPECEPLCIEIITRELGAPPDDVLNDCSLSDDTQNTTPFSATVHWSFGPQCVGGRRPSGYAARECSAVPERIVGEYFAEQARLEAASVRAFLDLANALAAHGAPRVLVQACRRAAAEEVVHAVLVGRLAVRHGVTPQFHHGTPAPQPTLEELAHANAVEGCLRETWGAMVATWQGRVATDPNVRAVMQRIAIEETKHATLSRAIDRWAMRKLDASARARILIARADAFAELATTVTAEVPDALVRDAGLPQPEVAATLLTAMHRAGALG